jgi:hypothetical protein
MEMMRIGRVVMVSLDVSVSQFYSSHIYTNVASVHCAVSHGLFIIPMSYVLNNPTVNATFFLPTHSSIHAMQYSNF